jgi:hypothetical protein
MIAASQQKPPHDLIHPYNQAHAALQHIEPDGAVIGQAIVLSHASRNLK